MKIGGINEEVRNLYRGSGITAHVRNWKIKGGLVTYM